MSAINSWKDTQKLDVALPTHFCPTPDPFLTTWNSFNRSFMASASAWLHKPYRIFQCVSVNCVNFYIKTQTKVGSSKHRGREHQGRKLNKCYSLTRWIRHIDRIFSTIWWNRITNIKSINMSRMTPGLYLNKKILAILFPNDRWIRLFGYFHQFQQLLPNELKWLPAVKMGRWEFDLKTLNWK